MLSSLHPFFSLKSSLEIHMPQFSAATEQKLKELQHNYLKKIPMLIQEMEQLHTILSSTKDPHPVLTELKRKTHSFIGSSGTFEFHDISKKVREFEKILLSIDNNVSRIEQTKLDKLWSHLVSIKGFALRIPPIQKISPNKTTNITPLYTNRPLDILFAGDDEQIQEKFLCDVSESNHTVCFASNGEEALSNFEAGDFDLVVLEIVMPKMDGFEAARHIKEKSIEKYIPILFLTSANREQDLVKCIESGGDDFLVKPYQPGILNAKIFSLDRVSRLINNGRT